MQPKNNALVASKKPLAPFIYYLIFLYLSMTFVWIYGVRPLATKTLSDTTLSYAIIEIVVSFLINILPVFLYLKYIDKVDAFEYLQLKQYWKRGVIIGTILAVLIFLLYVWELAMPSWKSFYITWDSILSIAILTGFFEEIPFRGFILKKLQERFNFWTSAIISSALFACVHLPNWIASGSLTIASVVFVFIFGAIMAIMLKYSKSLWTPIIFHSLFDGIRTVIFSI
jgi:membrane protease YdiL (CAAX protease family)